MNKASAKEIGSPSQHIASYIAGLTDWRGERLARLRQIVLDAQPGMVEDWKWETPVWSYNGNVLAVAAFKDHVKINFFKGAALDDPHALFNAGLEAKTSRSIDLTESDKINENDLKDLIRSAAALNSTAGKKA